MGDFYIKPGNQERGWNDPPHFSYRLQNSGAAAKRTALNKRVPPPQISDPGSGPCPPPVTSTLPPGNTALPPPPMGGFTPPPPPPKSQGFSSGAMDSPPCSSRFQTDPPEQPENEPDLEDVTAPLYRALTACGMSVKKQVCDDVEKRLKLLEEVWRSGKLSLPVRCRMNGLSQALRRREWDTADEIHRGLMVDYVNEVSQWMVGVKRLIAETRNLDPELLHSEETDRTTTTTTTSSSSSSSSEDQPQ